MRRLRVGMAQINTTVGDFPGNTKKILDSINEARKFEVDLLTFPELAICGYPPEDLLFKPHFIQENLRSLDEVIKASVGLTVAVGFVEAEKDNLYNAVALIGNGKLVSAYRKIHLPNYGVFDENRYFQAGNACPVFSLGETKIGINICEDIWIESGPTTVQAHSGAEVIINISASPYHSGKGEFREKMLADRARENLSIIIYNNLIGGQDELVFDGNSLILDEKGAVIARGKQFEEDLVIADLGIDSVIRARETDPKWKQGIPAELKNEYPTTGIVLNERNASTEKPALPERDTKPLSLPGEIYNALVVGARDYIIKNGFRKVVIGLSGGIDSTLVATIAVDALGPENVIGISMPSRYSSEGSKSDAELLTANLGMRFITVPIEEAFNCFLGMLETLFEGQEPGVAEENLQARIRGNILMALSNKFGWIVLTTGNKSEMATGYATLYGDMAGGFAVIKDVPKMTVYEICRYRNSVAGWDIIPVSTIEKPPSAELRPDQKDADSLPPYEILDPILTAYVEEDKSIEQIIAMGFNEETVVRAARLVDTSEYKRRQSPPGVKITPRAFGRDRRLPITNRFRDNTHRANK